MRVTAEVSYDEREDDYGRLRQVTTATCSKCGNEAWAWGQRGASKTRCLVELRETCPEDEENYYVG